MNPLKRHLKAANSSIAVNQITLLFATRFNLIYPESWLALYFEFPSVAHIEMPGRSYPGRRFKVSSDVSRRSRLLIFRNGSAHSRFCGSRLLTPGGQSTTFVHLPDMANLRARQRLHITDLLLMTKELMLKSRRCFCDTLNDRTRSF